MPVPDPIPHPIPYQGSKRQLAAQILAVVKGRKFQVLYEPFAGSAAISLAAAAARQAERFVISDSLEPLVAIWRAILDDPNRLADAYEALWTEQFRDPRQHFMDVRGAFNASPQPARLLYLLARCVKNSPRFNKDGHFNQGADHRRHGMHPDKMRRNLTGAGALLRGRAVVTAGDFEDSLAAATPNDVVYMDPPYGGTTYGTDRRYHQGLERERLIASLQTLSHRGVPYLLSYDGRCGTREYGEPLPTDLIGARRLELMAGRSSQSTLAGRAEITIESLYISNTLLEVSKIDANRKRPAGNGMTSQEIAAAFGVTVEAWEALDERAILEGLPREMWDRASQAAAKYAQAVDRLNVMTEAASWPHKED